MLADNTSYLIEHARQRHQQTLERARRALAELAATIQSSPNEIALGICAASLVC